MDVRRGTPRFKRADTFAVGTNVPVPVAVASHQHLKVFGPVKEILLHETCRQFGLHHF